LLSKNNKPKVCSYCEPIKAHCGTIVFCTDRRVNSEVIAEAMKEQGASQEIVLCLKSSYGHESAGNKIQEKDFVIAQALKLGIGPGHFGKVVAVFGHNHKCGGMNAQHELHKLEFKIEKEKNKGNKTKTEFFKKKIKKLKEDPIYGWVALDMKEFNPLISELKKIKKDGFFEFAFSDKFRMLLEEFNVLVQLGKLIKRKDFRNYYFMALKDGRGKIKLIGGIYSPKEKLSKGATFTSVGSVDFSFSLLYKTFGEKKAKEFFSFFGLKHEKGNPLFQYSIKN